MRFAIFIDEGFEIGKIVGYTRNCIGLQSPQKRLRTFDWVALGIFGQCVLDNRMDRPLSLRRQLMREITRTRRTNGVEAMSLAEDSGVMA